MSVLKLIPAYKDYLWGGRKLIEKYGKQCEWEFCAESWELSFHKDGFTKTADGKILAETLTEKDLGENCKRFSFFPVLIKFIDAKENLSVQVHPSDAYALKNENSFGKTEMWYIAEAEEGAGIYCGLKEDTDKAFFEKKVKDGSVEELLNFIPVKKGECYFIEAGTLHAIGKGCLICEIQQNSNLTYRVYDYNRKDREGKPRALHLEKALEVIDFSKYKPKVFADEHMENQKTLAVCDYFRVREVKVTGSFSTCGKGSFICLNCIDGMGKINDISFAAGDSFFISADENFTVKGSCVLLMTDIPSNKYYAGIDVGGTFIKGGIVDENGNVLLKEKIPTGKNRPQTEIVADMANLVKDLCVKANVRVESVGLGVPGTIDSKNGIVVYSNNLNWKKFPLGKELSNLLGLPCKMTNDANAAALGEYFFLKNQYRSMVFITLGTGVGGGIILDGKLFEGYKSAGAELGHQVIKTGGEKCTCGRRGCFEAYCSVSALIKETIKEMQKNPDSLLWNECGHNLAEINGVTIFAAYRKGDSTAVKTVKRYIKYLAEGCANAVNTFRPEILLIGGGISNEGDAIILPLKKHLQKMIFGGTRYAKLTVDTAKQKNDAGLIGAAFLNRKD